MKGIDDVFFVPENETQIKIGDYYYIDGSLSHEYQDTKECIGVVFCIGYNLGYTKGSVVALRDAITEEGQLLHLWRNVNDGNEKNGINEKNNGIRFKMAALKTDFGGLFYSKHLFDDEYVAINLARQYPIELSSEKTSGWYLPSSGQMWQIAYRFIDTDNYAEQKAILNLADKYMVSQAREAIYPLCLDLREPNFSYGNIDDKFLVRPVFSF